jgi:hypothetical protein
LRVNKLVIQKQGQVHSVMVETTGLTGKRLRVSLGTINELAQIGPLVEKAREAPDLRSLYALRGGM